jgi:polyhydroxyalkanoate synthesis regulator phasin
LVSSRRAAIRCKEPPAEEGDRVNPFEYQKRLMEQFEKNLASYFEKLMREPSTMQVVTRNLAVSLDLAAAIKKQVHDFLEALAIPTEKDMARLYETVNRLESRVLDLEDELGRLRSGGGERGARGAGARAGGAVPRAAARKAAVRGRRRPARETGASAEAPETGEEPRR